jgi:hypothetical protein
MTTTTDTDFDDFVDPAAATGTSIVWSDHLGSLLMFEVLDQEHDVATAHGNADPIRVNVHIVDGPGQDAVYEDVLIFPRVLIRQLKDRVGRKVLGRLEQGESKNGQSPPWLLATPDDADKAKCRSYLVQEAAEAPF